MNNNKQFENQLKKMVQLLYDAEQIRKELVRSDNWELTARKGHPDGRAQTETATKEREELLRKLGQQKPELDTYLQEWEKCHKGCIDEIHLDEILEERANDCGEPCDDHGEPEFDPRSEMD